MHIKLSLEILLGQALAKSNSKRHLFVTMMFVVIVASATSAIIMLSMGVGSAYFSTVLGISMLCLWLLIMNIFGHIEAVAQKTTSIQKAINAMDSDETSYRFHEEVGKIKKMMVDL